MAANGGDPRTSDVLDGVHYPSRDGKPMAENTAQWTALVVDGAVLDCRYADDPNVLVAGDVLVYPQRGNPRNSVAPDVLVAFGVPKRPHRTPNRRQRKPIQELRSWRRWFASCEANLNVEGL